MTHRISRRTALAGAGALAGGAALVTAPSPAGATADGFGTVEPIHDVGLHLLTIQSDSGTNTRTVVTTAIPSELLTVSEARVCASGDIAYLYLQVAIDGNGEDPSLGDGYLCLRGDELTTGTTSYEPAMPPDLGDGVGQPGWGGPGILSDPGQAGDPPDPDELTFFHLITFWANFEDPPVDPGWTFVGIDTPLLLFAFGPANGNGQNLVSRVQPFSGGLTGSARLWVNGLLYELDAT